MHYLFLLAVLLCTMPMTAKTMKSPNGRLVLTTETQGLRLSYKGKPVLDLPVLGYAGTPSAQPLPDFRRHGQQKQHYVMLAGKRLQCLTRLNEYSAALSPTLTLRVRLYDDGLAFRYELSGLQGQRLPEERTTYRIADGTRRWMMPWSDGYEGFYPLATTSVKGRWAFPALLEPADGTFVLLTEANIERRQSAASMHSEGERFHIVPDQNEVNVSGEWHSPWRLAIVGSLADVVESTLVTDVSEPNRIGDTSWIQPGVVSWQIHCRESCFAKF